MEPLNLLVSLSHFGDGKGTLPPKESRRAKKSRNVTDSHCTQRISGPRRAFNWLRTAAAR